MSLKKETVKLSVITGIAVFAGLIFHVILGRRFGLSWQLDAFFIVITLYGWLCLFNTFLTSLYIPVFNEVKKGDLKEGLAFADVVLKWLLLIAVFIVLLILLLNDWLIGLIAPGFTQKGIILSRELNRIMVFAIIFYSIFI